jgi:hypothetical protein
VRRLSILCAIAGCATAGREQPDGQVPMPDAPVLLDAPIDAPPYACTSNDTCAGATSLGSVSGDTGADQLSTTGTRAAWFRVRVTEDEGGFGGVAEQVHVTLTSPATADFGLFVYVNTGHDVVECSRTAGTTTTNGKVVQTREQWGETNGFGNGSDDSRDVSIEVRPLSGTCAPDQMWQLSIQGD